MSKDFDEIEITILEEGTIRTVTDPISPANHLSATDFVKLLDTLTGTISKKTRRSNKHVHQHDHEHLKSGGHSH